MAGVPQPPPLGLVGGPREVAAAVLGRDLGDLACLGGDLLLASPLELDEQRRPSPSRGTRDRNSICMYLYL